jgi:membrane associated rhomboid family serine protease
MSTQPTRARQTHPSKRVMPANPKAAAAVVLAFTALLYAVEAVDAAIPANLDHAGIQSRTISGLDGVLWAPLLHGGWDHLIANTVPIVLFGFLAMSAGIGQWLAVTATIWVFSGVGVWLTGPPDAVTIGASGLAFGWLAYLLVRGFFNRSPGQLAIASALFLLYGGMLWGVLPIAAGVSWQGHLFGAVSGVFAAWLVARADKAQLARTRGGTLPA